MKVLILGGDGFIGSHFADQAVRMGHEVTVFDKFPDLVSKNLEHQKNKIRFISSDFNNRDDLSRALEGQDIAFHFVGLSNPAESWNDPFFEVDQCLRPSIQFFDLAVQKGVRKIVFPSSGGTIYGPQKGLVEEEVLPKPISPHGIVKLTLEHFLQYFKEHNRIMVDIYRIGNPYGPRQPFNRPQGVIGVWIKKIISGSEIEVYGDDKTLRDYIYVKDVAFLMTNSLKNIDSSNLFNIGTGKGISIIQLLEIFKNNIKEPFKYRILDRRPSDITSIVLDNTKILTHFPGFKFQKIEDKFAETWEFYKDKHNKNL